MADGESVVPLADLLPGWPDLHSFEISLERSLGYHLPRSSSLTESRALPENWTGFMMGKEAGPLACDHLFACWSYPCLLVAISFLPTTTTPSLKAKLRRSHRAS